MINQMMTYSKQISSQKNRNIANSMQKLQKVASQGRFRIKSLRIKTTQTDMLVKQKCATEKNHEQKLIQYGFKKQFLTKLYQLKAQQSMIKTSQQKYQAFIRSINQKLQKTRVLNMASFNFPIKTAQMFLKQIIRINNRKNIKNVKQSAIMQMPIISYDFTNCAYLNQVYQANEQLSNTNNQQNNKMIALKILQKDKNVVKMVLRNMSLDYQQISDIFHTILSVQKIYEIDISNQGSQSMNRLGNNYDIFESFFSQNKTTSVIKLNNLSLKRQGVDKIYKGISQNTYGNPLKVLCLKNNGINEHLAGHITVMAKTGITHLDLSENPLSSGFYLALGNWRASTINYLDLSSTEMNSQSFISFLSKVQQNKALQTLHVDHNNFSHHWFNQTKQIFETNSSIQKLSMIDCSINRLSETFKGLLHNRYLKKINISNNQFNEGAKQLCQLIKVNKTLVQIKLKFCNIKTEQLVQIVNSLKKNDTILSMDISQNFLDEEGAHQIVKTLNTNKMIENIGIDKMPVPLRLKKQIEQKLENNKKLKKQKKLLNLKKQNKIIKNIDVGSWEDVDKMKNKINVNQHNIKLLNTRVEKLSADYQKKKFRFYEILKQYRQRQQKLLDQIDSYQKKLEDIDEEEIKVMQHYEKQIRESKQEQTKQTRKIQALIQQIKQENMKNKRRENELEDAFENKKYLIKKQDKTAIKTSSKKTGFDTTTALNSKRKSKKL